MQHDKETQIEWTVETPSLEYQVVSGRQFSLINKVSGIKEDVYIPFDAAGNLNNEIAQCGNTLFIGTGPKCYEFAAKTQCARRGNIGSAYILNDGRCVLLRPHHHDNTARIILPRVLVPETYDYDREFIVCVNAHLMPLYTRAIRVQMLPDGIGVTVDMVRAPNDQQLQSIQEYYESTCMKVFVAEIQYNTRMIGRIRTWLEFNEFIVAQRSKTFASILLQIPDVPV